MPCMMYRDITITYVTNIKNLNYPNHYSFEGPSFFSFTIFHLAPPICANTLSHHPQAIFFSFLFLALSFFLYVQVEIMADLAFVLYSTFGVLAFILIYQLIAGAIYRLYFSPISHIPGPKIAALTFWYAHIPTLLFPFLFLLRGRGQLYILLFSM